MLKFSFRKQVITGFVITIFLVFAVAFISYFSVKNSHTDAGMIDHTHEVISSTDHILQLVIDAEAGTRNYIITGKPVYVEAQSRSESLVPVTLQQLNILVDNDPIQVKNVDTLEYYVAKKLAAMANLVSVYNGKGFQDAKAVVSNNIGKYYMDQIRKTVIEIKNIEDVLMKSRKLKSEQANDQTIWIIVIGSILILAMILILLSYITKTFKQQKQIEQSVLESNAELDIISKNSEAQNWVLEGAVVVDAAMRGAQTLAERAECIVVEISKYVKADLGAFYIADPNSNMLKLTSTYAFELTDGAPLLNSKEGLIGQTIVQKKGMVFYDIPNDYVKIRSALGNAHPKAIFIQPIYHLDQLRGVMELAFTGELPPNMGKFFDKVVYSIGVAIAAAQARVEMQNLIERTQQQAEELQAQQEELRTTNEELIHKTQELQASEEELRVQQEELRQINSELEEKAELLEERNRAVDQAHQAISLKAEELELTSKYKSEFLANMSHELRTPLNSILILARILRDNKNANLNDDQVKYANVIHNAGSDLLTLINDILDLSKIESGKIDLTIEDIRIDEVKQDLEQLFREVANTKKINFDFVVADDVPTSMISDRVRMEQILKNLLSNAFKFTSANGTIAVDVRVASPDQQYFSTNLSSKTQQVLSFSVIDTGIGIPLEKQKVIFEAFQQADGSTSRKYGGTGLGLSISRELSFILGGEIGITSEPGQGSVFTLYLPMAYNEDQLQPSETVALAPKPSFILHEQPKPIKASVIDNIQLSQDNKDHVLLIIEDDVNFAEVLKDYAVERGFKPLLAYQGDTGLEMAKKHLPSAIVLDIMLPVMDGWAVLKQLKGDPKTRDIPVHMMSAGDERPVKAQQEGAIGFMKKPVDKDKLDEAFNLLIMNGQVKLNKVLIVEDSEIQSENLRSQLVMKNSDPRQAFDGAQAIEFLENETGFDCIILDLSLPDISGLDLLDKIKAREEWAEIPVVINTAMELDQASMERVMKYTDAMVLKNNKSNDRLLDEVNLFMNKIKTIDESRTIHRPARAQLNGAPNSTAVEKALHNRTVLVVDDDMRNIFALTSALQTYDLQIVIANNGIEALKKLDENPSIDIVLMDIMMPEMDGYEAMQEIRKQNRFSKLPIIALTAKAMKNDREKCIESGANDYISKPVDIEKLISLMRVWLS